MINSTVVRELGLKTSPVRRPITLQGFGGGEEAPREWVLVKVGCPLIGLEIVEVPAYVVQSKVVPGLLLGAKFIDQHGVLQKIITAKAKYGSVPPGMDLKPVIAGWVSVTVVDSVEGGGGGMFLSCPVLDRFEEREKRLC